MPRSEAHGGLDSLHLRELGVVYEELLDFSTNVNPFGPPPAVAEAWRGAEVSAYPDRSALELREAVAAHNDLPLECVLLGAGASQLIWLITRFILEPSDHCLVVSPTFGEYRRSAAAGGAEVMEVRLPLDPAKADLAEVREAIARGRPRLTFLCNPNNPTGWDFEDGEILRLAELCAPGWLVVDEAYRLFLRGEVWRSPPPDNLLILRSMTKAHAIPGLRLGYVLGASQVLSRLADLQPPWSVSAPAQAAGLAALGARAHLTRTVEATRRAGEALKADLHSLGLTVVPSPMHFSLVEVGDADLWQRRLVAEGCLTRDATSFGLPGHLRVGTRRPPENERLVEVWREALAKWK